MSNPMRPSIAPLDEPTPRLLLLKSEHEEKVQMSSTRDTLDLLRSLRGQSEQIITEAKVQAEAIRDQAREAGRAEGEEAAVMRTLDTLRLRNSLLRTLSGEIQEIIFSLARELHQQTHLESLRESFDERLRKALSSLRGEPLIRLFAAPASLASLDYSLDMLRQELGYLGQIEIVADATLSADAFRLQGNGCSVLSSRTSFLERVLQRLADNPRLTKAIRDRLLEVVTDPLTTSTTLVDAYQTEIEQVPEFHTEGSLFKLDQSVLHLTFPGGALEQRVCVERTDSETAPLIAQIVALERNNCLASPLGSPHGVKSGARVFPSPRETTLAVGSHLLGCVLGSQGEIQQRLVPELEIRDEGTSAQVEYRSLQSAPPSALQRKPISKIFQTGLRAVDTFTTIGCGQRIGIFAEPGVGKSTLLGSLAHSSAADVVVVALVGERGREVREFLDQSLSQEAQKKAIVVYSTSDEPALARINASLVAMTVAEYFRDQGQHVLLLLDSLTRLCRAYRELGLIAGEAAVRKGYPASVFARLPEFIERAGCGVEGSITAMYTVLLSADLDEDPMVEEIKSLTDGHLILRRDLADRGHFPAIDVLQSISRLAHQLSDKELQAAVVRCRKLLARLQKDRELILFGGTPDEELAEAIRLESRILEFLKQERGERMEFEVGRESLLKLLKSTHLDSATISFESRDQTLPEREVRSRNH